LQRGAVLLLIYTSITLVTLVTLEYHQANTRVTLEAYHQANTRVTLEEYHQSNTRVNWSNTRVH
jgi:hypothetical protein